MYGKGTGSGSIGVIGEANVANAVGVFGISTSPAGVGVYARNLGGGRAIFAEGNAAQTITSNGLVKAMVYVERSGIILSCYNSQLADGGASLPPSGGTGCGFTVTTPLNGVYRINYGFPVDNRFVSVAAQYATLDGFGTPPKNAGANFRFFGNTSVEVFTFRTDNANDTGRASFNIILY